MKTFETEKHNIPEGATHHGIYGCDTDVYFKEDDGVFLEWKHDNWSLSSFSHHKWVKPIPTEPKYRCEKVADSIFDLKEELEGGFLFTKKAWGEFVTIKTDTELAGLYEMASHDGSKIAIHRRVEISERDLFIEKAREYCHTGHSTDSVLGKLFDAGCRFEK